MSEKVDVKAALSAISNQSIAFAKVLRDAAQVYELQGATLKLLAGEADGIAATAQNVDAAQAEAPKLTRGRKAATGEAPKAPEPPKAPAVTLDDLKALAQQAADAKGKDQVIAVLQRNGINRFGEAKVEMYPKLKADLEAVIAGKDAEASSTGWD